jgi:hypothetical protein
MTSKAVPIARAIRAEGMTAKIEKGALVLEGGDTDRAKAMREAKTLSALAKACEGTTGTDRNNPQNSKGEGEGEGEGKATPRPTTRAEIIREALALLQAAECGDGDALKGDEIALIKPLAKVAAAIVKAEAEAEKAEKAEATRKAARA